MSPKTQGDLIVEYHYLLYYKATSRTYTWGSTKGYNILHNENHYSIDIASIDILTFILPLPYPKINFHGRCPSIFRFCLWFRKIDSKKGEWF